MIYILCWKKETSNEVIHISFYKKKEDAELAQKILQEEYKELTRMGYKFFLQSHSYYIIEKDSENDALIYGTWYRLLDALDDTGSQDIEKDKTTIIENVSSSIGYSVQKYEELCLELFPEI